MKFTLESIMEFKKQNKNYISYRTKLKPFWLHDLFYDGFHRLEQLYPGRNIKYCPMGRNTIVVGDFEICIRYEYENNVYYLIIAANSYGAPAQDFAIGKVVDGKVYLIREVPTTELLEFIEIDEKSIAEEESDEFTKSYDNYVMFLGRGRDMRGEINAEDINCINIAYEGVKAFKKLVKDIDVA